MQNSVTPKISRHGKSCVNCAKAKVKCVEKNGVTSCERYVESNHVTLSRFYVLGIASGFPSACTNSVYVCQNVESIFRFSNMETASSVVVLDMVVLKWKICSL